MSDFIANPPDAAALMTSARSFGNYDLAGAIADLIDNSIKAQATTIDLKCIYNEGRPEIRILDNGTGMSRAELHAAMRPASTNPLDHRSPDDLGRFGWGLKSASFSQCRRLTVITSRERELSGAVWDLRDIDGWRMGVLDRHESALVCNATLLESNGTEVIWNDCDRLSEDGSLSAIDFNALIAHATERLALIFHRFLSGEASRRKLDIALNGRPIPRTDPFFRQHPATQPLEREPFTIGGQSTIQMQPYILPHYSKLNSTELDTIAGEEGLLRNQGFYIYRNDRLILYGTWFRLIQHGELSQLVRVSIDVPNSLDSMWKLTIDKSDAQLPAVLRARLRQLVARLKSRSARTYTSRGARVSSRGATSMWLRVAKHGEIRYEINRDHPLIEAMFSEADTNRERATSAALLAIEQSFPVGDFTADATRETSQLNQTATNANAFREFLRAALPGLLLQVSGDMDALVTMLKATEPFATHWRIVNDYLSSEGWIVG